MKNLIARKAKAFITAILDLRSTFSSAGSLIHATGAFIFGDVMPIDTTGFNLGQGMQKVYLVIGITTEVDSAGDGATIDFSLMSHSTATVSSGVTHLTTGAVAEANMTAGTIVACIPLPQGTYGKYLGVVATVAGEAVTAGAANAYLTLDPPQGWKAYPAAGY